MAALPPIFQTDSLILTGTVRHYTIDFLTWQGICKPRVFPAAFSLPPLRFHIRFGFFLFLSTAEQT